MKDGTVIGGSHHAACYPRDGMRDGDRMRLPKRMERAAVMSRVGEYQPQSDDYKYEDYVCKSFHWYDGQRKATYLAWMPVEVTNPIEHVLNYAARPRT